MNITTAPFRLPVDKSASCGLQFRLALEKVGDGAESGLVFGGLLRFHQDCKFDGIFRGENLLPGTLKLDPILIGLQDKLLFKILPVIFSLLEFILRPVKLLAMTVTLSGIGITILSKDSDSRLPVLKLPLSGVLYGIGAGLGQGVGLVLSKIGMEHYTASMPSDAASGLLSAMPFAGTFIRVVTGIIGFSVIILLMRKAGGLKTAVKDRTSMVCCLVTTLLGPVIGVSLSLKAVQYTSAGIASTLMGLTPVLILIPYSIYAKQRITLREVAGTFITVAGVALFFLL